MNWLKAAIDYGIIGVLVVMSMVAVGVALERRNFYRKRDVMDSVKRLGFRKVSLQTE